MAHFTLIPLTLLLAQAPETLPTMLKRIEQRYNTTATLKSEFEQTMAVAQGRRVTERGILYLRKPGRMRWEYAQPTGKLFLCDAKRIYYVVPSARRVEVSEMRESDDLRAPLAFLLGKLDFARDFNRFEHSRPGTQWKIRAYPKSAKSPYEYVEFFAEPDGRLSVVAVKSKDGSTMSYAFQSELRNVPLAASLFEFQKPEGFEILQLRAN
ncbi:MAG: outer membrane lipoprotein carrier protein LolA [Acidobacteria bacterium]|nr:outer membrane lipoprotein carrier protein LolA [Acidobacteriota bacterium]